MELATDPANSRAIIEGWRRDPAKDVLAEVRTAICWDNFFVPCYALLLACLCFACTRRWQWLFALLPLLAGLCDWSENYGILQLLKEPSSARWSRWVMSFATAKFTLLSFALLVVVISLPSWITALPPWIKRSFGRAAETCSAAWKHVRSVLHVVAICRWSISSACVGLLLFTEPGTDLIRSLDDSHDNRWFLLEAAAVLWALNIWYWARTILGVKVNTALSKASEAAGYPAARCVTKWLPRILGIAVLAILARAIWNAAPATCEDGDDLCKAVAEVLHFKAKLVGAYAALFAAFVIARRKALNKKWPGALPKEPQLARHEQIGTVSKGTPVALALLLGSAFVLSVLMCLWPEVGPRWGSLTIVLIAASVWTAVGSVLTFVGLRRRLPLVAGLVIWAFAVSRFTDFRDVRTVESRVVRPGLKAFLQARKDSLPERKTAKRRILIVAAEGGGIRAAYWTAIVLGRLHDLSPALVSERLWAISGVSGGSVGATVFTSLAAAGATKLVEMKDRLPKGHIAEKCEFDTKPHECAAEAILAQDYLAANLAALLFPDLLQRFFPFHRLGDNADRARVFEAAWEEQWSLRVGNTTLSQPMEDLWQGRVETSLLPALFLNATSAETGQRVIFSPVRVAGFRGFGEAKDGLDDLKGGSVPLVTAAHLSSRFPYVSPAGLLAGGHIVDGGYFENSGTATALDVIAALQDEGFADLEPLLVTITSSKAPGQVVPEDADRFANDLLAPPLTLYRTRDARGASAQDEVARALRVRWKGTACKPFNISLPEGLPLSWALSRTACKKMNDHLDQQQERLNSLIKALTEDTCPDPWPPVH